MNSSYKDHATIEEVRSMIQAAIGEYDEFLKKRTFRWTSGFVAKMILQGTVKVKKKVDRRTGGKTILKSRQEWALPAQLVQLKTGQGEKGCCEVICDAMTIL